MYTLKCVKVNVRSGSDIGRVPTYVGILSIILAVFFALMLLPLAPNDYLGLQQAEQRRSTSLCRASGC